MTKSKLRALFLDCPGGNYLPQAIKLSESFSKMYYHIPNVSPFPTPHSDAIGSNIEGIEVLTSIWDNLYLFDIVIVPDIYLGDYVKVLKQMGKLTFGGTLDVLETQRDQFYSVQDRLDMDVAPFQKIQGFKALRKFIKQKKNNGSFAKINFYRGAGETFRYENPNHSEPMLDKIEYELGPLAEDLVYIVQEPIDGNVIEIGMDSFVIDGDTPDHFLFGVEAKDAAFLGKFESKDKAPKAITQINEAFNPALKVYHATNFYSTEIRSNLDTKKNYYNDICSRMAQPASNVYLAMYDNWSDIIEKGASGILVEPTSKYKYGVELLLKSKWVSNDFLTVTFPDEYKDNIKLKGSFIRNEQHYVVPFKRAANYELDAFGSVVVVGNDIQEIMNKAIEIASSVEGYDIYYQDNVLESILSEIQNLEDKIGYKF